MMKFRGACVELNLISSSLKSQLELIWDSFGYLCRENVYPYLKKGLSECWSQPMFEKLYSASMSSCIKLSTSFTKRPIEN